jgi:uncharacterized membrane protein YkvA (DUF1232 family)
MNQPVATPWRGRANLKPNVLTREDEPKPSPIVSGATRDFANSAKIRAMRSLSIKWRRQAQRLPKEALVFYFAFRHPRVPWYARLVAASTVAYLLSPIQLIPSWIPVIGFLDDFLVLCLGVKLFRRIIADDVLADCRKRAETVERKKKEILKSTVAALGAAAVLSLWFLGTVIASVLMLEYFLR